MAVDLPRRRLGLIRESEAKKRESRLPIAIEMNWARGGTPTDTLLGFINNNGIVCPDFCFCHRRLLNSG